jgi:hypothetical protein
MMDSMQDFEKGQILLIVVLVMVTALTIALSVAARSITNVRSSQEAASSEQAFSAAEAGIEKSLTSKTAVTGTLANNASYQTTLVTVGGPEIQMNSGSPVLKDEPVDLWLSTYPSYTSQRSGNITIYWGSASDTCSANEANNTMAAVEIIVFTGDITNIHTTRVGVDPCTARRLVNAFQAANPGGTVAGSNYSYSYSLDGANAVNSGLFVRIVPLYAPTTIAVRGCDRTNVNCTAFPTQGTLIQSIGTIATTERKIQAYRYNPQLPAELIQYNFFVPK